MSVDPLAGLDLGVLTITEDPEEGGVLALNYDGMTDERALFLLESAKFLILYGYWFGTEPEDEDPDFP